MKCTEEMDKVIVQLKKSIVIHGQATDASLELPLNTGNVYSPIFLTPAVTGSIGH
jgi:hypothetical protein